RDIERLIKRSIEQASTADFDLKAVREESSGSTRPERDLRVVADNRRPSGKPSSHPRGAGLAQKKSAGSRWKSFKAKVSSSGR
ncbi:MAG: hypothetical protein RLZZ385_1110, partial [Pseudomonadota bacterium]